MKTLFIFLICPLLLRAEIIEILKIEETLPYLEQKPFVLIDIDNTLIKPTQWLGSDTWFTHHYKNLLKEHPKEVAKERTILDWQKVRSISGTLPVEKTTKEVMDKIFASGLPVIALTTRGLSFSDTTFDELASIGVDFKRATPSLDDFYFFQGKGVLFRNGILFTNGTHKGTALVRLLEHLKLKPEKVLFLNDKEDHLQELAESIEEKGIRFIGLRYGHLDEEIATFDPQIADLQWKHFGQMINDHEARFLLDLQTSIRD